MAINFIQYMRPDGRQHATFINRSPEIEKMAIEIEDGIPGNFACEVLMSGHVSLTYETADDDLDIEVCKNCVGVGDAVDRLIIRLHKHLKAPQPQEDK
jgi:hypothetical protein